MSKIEYSAEETFEKAEQVTKLLNDAIDLYKEDRGIALKNYNALKTQYERITDPDGEIQMDMSEEGKLEKELNVSVGLIFKSGERLEKVIRICADIMINQLNNFSREKIAEKFVQIKQIAGPVDITEIKRRSIIKRQGLIEDKNSRSAYYGAEQEDIIENLD